MPTVVWTKELAKLSRGFARLHSDLALEELMRYQQRLNSYAVSLQRHTFTQVNVLAGATPEEQAFLACLLDEDRIDDGEAECLTIAAYRGDTCYSDDYAFKLEVEAFNAGKASCPRQGHGPPPHHPLTVHGTVHLLHEAVNQGVLRASTAEDHYSVMRDSVGSKLPAGPLVKLRGTPQAW